MRGDSRYLFHPASSCVNQHPRGRREKRGRLVTAFQILHPNPHRQKLFEMAIAAIDVSASVLANSGLSSPSRRSPVTYSPVIRLPTGFGAPDLWACLHNDVALLIFERVAECSDGGKQSDLSNARLVCRSWAVQGASAVMTLKPTAKPLPSSRWYSKFAVSALSRFLFWPRPLHVVLTFFEARI